MKLFVRCAWNARLSDLSLKKEMDECGRIVASPQVTELAGTQWFRLARSKQAALKRPFVLVQFSDKESWREVKFDNQVIARNLDLWNGLDGAHSANLSITLRSDNESSLFVLALPQAVAPQIEERRWHALIGLTDLLSRTFDGIATASASELIACAEAMKLSNAPYACFTAAWRGSEKRQAEVLYKEFRQALENEPSSLLGEACTPLGQHLSTLQEITDFVARKSAIV